MKSVLEKMKNISNHLVSHDFREERWGSVAVAPFGLDLKRLVLCPQAIVWPECPHFPQRRPVGFLAHPWVHGESGGSPHLGAQDKGPHVTASPTGSPQLLAL